MDMYFFLKHGRSCVFPYTRVVVNNSITSQCYDKFVMEEQSSIAKLDDYIIGEGREVVDVGLQDCKYTCLKERGKIDFVFLGFLRSQILPHLREGDLMGRRIISCCSNKK